MACIACPGQKTFVINKTRYAWSWFDKVSQAEINAVTTKLANDLSTEIQQKFSNAKCCDECNKSSSGLSVTANAVGAPYRKWWSLWAISIQKIKGKATITVICTPSI